MTMSQRRLLEKFAAGEKPLNRAIRAALSDIDRPAEARTAPPCGACHGSGYRAVGCGGIEVGCMVCGGTGRKP